MREMGRGVEYAVTGRTIWSDCNHTLNGRPTRDFSSSRFGPMTESNRRSVRIVVQCVREGSRSCYRLIAYDDRKTYSPVEFESASDFLKALRLIEPSVSENSLENGRDPTRSRIVFAAQWNLDDTELSLLGFSV